ncbi:hypothetical protein V2J09_005594 [Rumex salicifolius]
MTMFQREVRREEDERSDSRNLQNRTDLKLCEALPRSEEEDRRVGYCSGLILLDPNTFAQGWRNGQRSMESSLSLVLEGSQWTSSEALSRSLSVKELWTKHKRMEEIRSDEPKKVLKECEGFKGRVESKHLLPFGVLSFFVSESSELSSDS